MKLKTFPGGLHPPDNKRWSEHKPIETCPLPEELVVPMAQHIGAPAEVCVQKGDLVKKGQVIGQAKGFVSVPVHAPSSGEVVAVEPRLHPSGKALPAVVIRPDGEDRWVEGLEPGDPEALSADQLREKIRAAGIVGMGGATFPAHVKLSPPEGKKIDTLILNGVECEPFLTADHRLMLEQPDDVLAGVDILRKVLGVSRVYIGIEANKPDAIDLMSQACTGRGIEVVPLEVKYPQGAEKQLILAITGREVPSGGLPMDVGVVVQNVGTAAAVADAVLHGRPLVERICTVSGPLVAEPKNLRIRIGTPLAHLVQFCGGVKGEPAKIIMGGPMMGSAQLSLEVPATRGTSGLLLFGAGDVPLRSEGPCIRCGRCVQACPARIMPTTIAAYARLDFISEAEEYGAMDCIECGCCTYICPATLPLVQAIRYAKGAILAKRRKV
ncbi:electron transport complex subunit C [Desulfuromonas versatilis]|uniref:Ion-translocating oxidoreductase complex subunit C n=1 Tax=Desulfuromonas versatilis TaxID=2802975 RepID=A0ABN6E5L6_9BACT|nr:electron transport complex subunit RsxC [Desulfuromonas versatilis]BCR06924.1 electron transport complex subunit C [Desulfuromonas versatilis]